MSAIILPLAPMPAAAIDAALAAELRQRLGDDVQPRQCWRNSLLAMAEFDEAGAGALYYVEGWLLTEYGQYPVEHGWLEYEGAVVDVTVKDQAAALYWAVWRYSLAAVRVRVHRGGVLPFYMRSQRDRAAMIHSFYQLPLDHTLAKTWAMVGRAFTGIDNIYLEMGDLETLK